jgi:hypothetical protein
MVWPLVQLRLSRASVPFSPFFDLEIQMAAAHANAAAINPNAVLPLLQQSDRLQPSCGFKE